MFRANVLLREDACRVTGVAEPRHLKASHIKPWRDATDIERLNGANGLLLSPHIDHLFDEGYITFSSGQELVMVPEVRVKLLDAWGIDAGVRVGDSRATAATFGTVVLGAHRRRHVDTVRGWRVCGALPTAVYDSVHLPHSRNSPRSRCPRYAFLKFCDALNRAARSLWHQRLRWLCLPSRRRRRGVRPRSIRQRHRPSRQRILPPAPW